MMSETTSVPALALKALFGRRMAPRRSARSARCFLTTVAPIEGLELADQLHDAVKYIHGEYREAEPPELDENIGEMEITSVGGIPVKGQTVGAVIDKVEFRGKGIIELVQLRLLLADGAVRGKLVHLEVDQVPHTLPQFYHSNNALSIGERAKVDLPFMAQLAGKSEAELEKDLTGVVFRDIHCAEHPDLIPEARLPAARPRQPPPGSRADSRRNPGQRPDGWRGH